MNPYAPYRNERRYELAYLLRKYDMEPSLHAQEVGRMVAGLRD